MEPDKLPPGWAWGTLQDLGSIVSGGTPPSKDHECFDGDIAWITPADLTGYTAKMISRGRRNLSAKGLATCSAKVMPKRSVLFSSRAPIGYVAIAANEMATNQGFKSVIPHREIDESYLYHYLKGAKQLAEDHASGTTFKEISGSRFARLPIPVAPFPEQQRIVEKIETLFAELDKGEEALREVQKLLVRYRQSVLKAAVTGTLTAGWRDANDPPKESGKDLLARILKTRRETWQGRGKYKEPVEPDTDGLPELPDGWTWASLDQLISKVEAGKNYRCEERPPTPEETGIVKISAVTWEEFDEDESKTILKAEHVDGRYLIETGDLLISRANTLELVGASVVVGIVRRRLQLSDKVLRLRCVAPLENWLNFVLRSPLGRDQIQRMATGAQMSMRNISQKNLARICIPLPPKNEIERLVTEIADLRNAAKRMLGNCEEERKRSAALRQSILKDAFSGKLVPQDPSEEPAEKLLERIRAARAEKPKAKGKKAAA